MFLKFLFLANTYLGLVNFCPGYTPFPEGLLNVPVLEDSAQKYTAVQ